MIRFKQFLVESELLLEDLGTLKQVDKQYQNTFFNRKDLDPYLGKDAIIDKLDVTKVSDAIELMKEKKFENRGIIMKYGDIQVAMVFQKAFFKGKNNWTTDYDDVVFRSKFEKVSIAEKTFGTEIVDIFQQNKDWEKLVSTTNDPSMKLSAAKSRMDYITRIMKIFNKTQSPTFYVIKPDTKKKQIKSDRYVARKGSIPVNDKDLVREYEKQLKGQLSFRLDQFKLSKIKNISMDDILGGVKETGFPPKLLVDGYAYSINENTKLNIGHIINPNHSDKQSWGRLDNFVEYELNKKLSIGKDWDAMNKEFHEFWKTYEELKGEDNADWDACRAMAVKKKIIPPTKIKIALISQGGAIVPGSIAIESGSGFL